MFDFQNASVFKLSPTAGNDYAKWISPMLVSGEQIVQSFRTMRDGIVFTNKRIFTINVQGITGMKKDFTSLPYSKIQAFSVETAGLLDIDSEIELWFSGMNRIKFEFLAHSNVSDICRVISEYVLLN